MEVGKGLHPGRRNGRGRGLEATDSLSMPGLRCVGSVGTKGGREQGTGDLGHSGELAAELPSKLPSNGPGGGGEAAGDRRHQGEGGGLGRDQWPGPGSGCGQGLVLGSLSKEHLFLRWCHDVGPVCSPSQPRLWGLDLRCASSHSSL